MAHAQISWLRRVTFLVVAFLACTSAGRAAEKFSKAVEETYARHKADVLTKFTDKHGLVVELRDGKPAGIGDAAWRTGLAALCFALERDDANTQKYLKSLSEKCWKDGKPIRHPDSTETGKKTYSRDQFFPQMTACLFAHEYGNKETKKLARQLYGQFIEKIRTDNWALNEGEAAEIEKQNMFPVLEVAKRLDLFAGPKFKNADGHLTRKVFVSTLQLKSLELANPDTVKLFNSGKETFQYYGVHLLFHESLATIYCRPQTDDLIESAADLGKQAGHHNMAPFLWLRGDLNECKRILEAWPADWDHTDYVWQRSRQSQERSARDPSPGAEHPRLDYMLLRQLFNVAIRRR